MTSLSVVTGPLYAELMRFGVYAAFKDKYHHSKRCQSTDMMRPGSDEYIGFHVIINKGLPDESHTWMTRDELESMVDYE
jgi:hypothetical protein